MKKLIGRLVKLFRPPKPTIDETPEWVLRVTDAYFEIISIRGEKYTYSRTDDLYW